MTFAMITPALIVGAFAERMKFSALVLFMVLWVTFIYFPIAHMVWYWAGPDAHRQRRQGASRPRPTPPRRAAAQSELDAVKADAGLVFQWGALDFAGGTVVHINAGIAGLVGCAAHRQAHRLRPRPDRAALADHDDDRRARCSGSAGSASTPARTSRPTAPTALAMINTFVATAAAALSWLFVEWGAKGKPSLLGLVSGAIAGLVAVTPASGFAGPMGSIVLGLVAGAVCFVFCSTVKNALGYDDSLDVFGIHCVGGIIGALATGILVNPALGGAGIPDYVSKPGELGVADYVFGHGDDRRRSRPCS